MNYNDIKSCYIHIPFCKNICSYCDFCKNYYDELLAYNYLDALDKEIKEVYKNNTLDTLYIGGGTPSSLSINNLEKLFNILKIFKLNKTYEFTFECNYEDITEDLLIFLKNNKVNRLSIGIETFNEKYSKFLNRNINKKEMINKIKLSKKYFDNINIDLMYAFYNETLSLLKKDLDEFIKLDVTHISTYALIVEKHTKLYIEKIKEKNDDAQNKMYYMICDYLNKNGYKQYEISNFGKVGYYSAHNLTYWNNDNYYGFGLGASSFIKNNRITNTRNINKYIKDDIIKEKEILSKNDLIKDEVMLSLRKISGIDKNIFYKKYNIKLEDAFNYKKLVDDKLLIDTKNNLFISYDKLFVSNEIIIRLLNSFLLE